MIKMVKIEIACLLYLILSLAYMQFAFDNPIVDAVYFVKEDIFFILFLFYIVSLVNSTTEKLIVYSVILYRGLMMFSNIYTVFDFSVVFSNTFIIGIYIFVLIILFIIKWQR